MTKTLKNIRNVLKAIGRNAKVKISIAISIPAFLKIEVEYARNLADPDDTIERRG